MDEHDINYFKQMNVENITDDQVSKEYHKFNDFLQNIAEANKCIDCDTVLTNFHKISMRMYNIHFRKVTNNILKNLVELGEAVVSTLASTAVIIK